MPMLDRDIEALIAERDRLAADLAKAKEHGDLFERAIAPLSERVRALADSLAKSATAPGVVDAFERLIPVVMRERDTVFMQLINERTYAEGESEILQEETKRLKETLFNEVEASNAKQRDIDKIKRDLATMTKAANHRSEELKTAEELLLAARERIATQHSRLMQLEPIVSMLDSEPSDAMIAAGVNALMDDFEQPSSGSWSANAAKIFKAMVDVALTLTPEAPDGTAANQTADTSPVAG